MAFNDELAERFERLAALGELTGANRFRVNAMAKAARVIERHPADLRPLAGDAAALCQIDGIGKGIAEKIAEYARSGTIRELDDRLAEVPAGVLTLLEVPGLGPKTVQALWKQLGVTDVDALRRVIDSGEILALPRMGEKAVAKIEQSLAFAADASRRLHRGVAMPVAERLVERMLAVPGVRRAAFAGSLRRGAETVGDVDILAVADDPAAAARAFTEAAGVRQVIASGERKASVRIELPDLAGRWKGFMDDGDGGTAQADLRLVPEASWGAAMMYFTGSKAHNVRLRERAIARGMTLNEYGLFRQDDDGPEGEPVAGDSEAAVFEALGLPWIPPEIREDAGELRLDNPPRLIELEDIKAELHAHTTASDGRMPLRELVETARGRGYHTIAVTDHSRSSAQAGGLDASRLRAQRTEIEALRSELSGSISVLCGSEVDILADGSLDFDDDTLASLDLIVASPHAALDQDSAKATARILRAIEHPLVHVIGHPTGRIIGKRRGLNLAIDEIVAAAREHRVALEINSHWLRLDLRDHHTRAAVEAGCLIAIDCDVHAASDLDYLAHGVSTARRGWVTPEACVNAWDRDKLLAWLRSKGGGGS